MLLLREVQSYLPTSSESCWTPSQNRLASFLSFMTKNLLISTRSGDLISAADAPRAYSLGSKPVKLHHNCDSPTSASSTRPASSEMTGRNYQQQLLHPSSLSSSPPNYLKKSILGQTVKSLHKEALEASLNERVKQKDNGKTTGKKEAKDMEEEELNDMRKRAHSVGSKAL